MNKEEVLKLAEEAGGEIFDCTEFDCTISKDDVVFSVEQLLAFAQSCEKIGMEKAAKICDEQGREWDSDAVVYDKNYAAHCAEAIRAATLPPTPHEPPIPAT